MCDCNNSYPNAGPFPNRCSKCKSCENNGCLNYFSPDCILINTSLPCLGLSIGTSLSTTLTAIDAALCTVDQDITIINNTINNITNDITNITEQLTPCATWSELTLINGALSLTIQLPLWGAESGTVNFASAPEYSLDSCGTVRLKGFIQQDNLHMYDHTKNIFTTLNDANLDAGGGAFAILPNIPVSARPKHLVVTPIFIEYQITSTPKWHQTLGWLFIDTSGNMFVGATIALTEDVTFSIKFSIDNVDFSTL